MGKVKHLDADDSSRLTERQRRERDYYNEYARRQPVENVDMTSFLRAGTRPWDSYSFVYDFICKERTEAPQNLLEIGCGQGEDSVRLATVGYTVHGLDISPTNIASAKALAEKYDLANSTSFTVGAAETIPYPESSFDAVVGVDVLHHIDIENAVPEILRVLKPGGFFLFREHVAVPIFDALRNTALVRRFFPNEKSFEKHITEDERKLTNSDIDLIRSYFPDLQEFRFRVFSRLQVLFHNRKLLDRLEMFDSALIQRMPALSVYGGSVVLFGRRSR